jgi:hypothetical protein
MQIVPTRVIANTPHTFECLCIDGLQQGHRNGVHLVVAQVHSGAWLHILLSSGSWFSSILLQMLVLWWHSPYRTTLAYKTISCLLIGEPGDAMVAACQNCSALAADKYLLQEEQLLRKDDKSGASAGRVKPVTFDHSTATTWSDRTRFSHPQVHVRRCRYASCLTLSPCRGRACLQ